MAKLPKWTPDEEEFLRDEYRSFKSPQERSSFIRKLKEVSGIHRTINAIRDKAHELGVNSRDYPSMWTIQMVSDEVEVPQDTIRAMLRKNPEKFPSVKFGKFVYVSDETFLKLRQYYESRKVTPELLSVTYSVGEAAKILNFSEDEVNKLALFGALKGIKTQRGWYLYKDSVARIKRIRDTHHNEYWLRSIRHELNEHYERYLEIHRNSNRRRRAG